MSTKLFLVAIALTVVCIYAKPGALFHEPYGLEDDKRDCEPDMDPVGCADPDHKAHCGEEVMNAMCPTTCGLCKRGLYEAVLQPRRWKCPCWWCGCPVGSCDWDQCNK